MRIEDLHKLFIKSKGIATDTRKIQRDQLFFALKGDNFNGNQFASQALSKSGGYAIIDEAEYAISDKFILVKEVLKTLQELATFHRNYLKIPILAITGSNGKTTSKELINAVLKRKFETVATVGNLNNHIGVPLTLLSMKISTEFGIVEMGANHQGEIRALCEIAQPDYGYITNFGKAHLEGFGSVEGVIRGKSELYEHLKYNEKLIFLNIDDPIQQKHATYSSVFTFGKDKSADIIVEYPSTKKTAEVLHKGDHYYSILTGSYNAVNIAAAISIGNYFKVPKEAIMKAVAAYSPNNNRSQIVKIGNNTLLMDAYNANPTSMQAALGSFNAYPAENKWVILGDMFELGESSKTEHQDITSIVEGMELQQALLVGSNFYEVKVSNEKVLKFKDFKDLENNLRSSPPENCYILVKGSRGMALERVQDVIREVSSL